MRKVLKLDGVSLPGATTKPVVELTEMDRAMAHIPGWEAFFDPEFIVDGNARNMALPDNITQNNGTANTATTMPGSGAPAFDLDGARQIRPSIPFPTSAWTVFVVMRLTQSGLAQHIVGAASPPDSPDISPEMGVDGAANNARIWERGIQGQRLSWTPSEGYAGRTALVMFTGSTRDGLRLFEDGDLVADEPEETAPIDSGFLPGEWRFFNGCRGLIGNLGLLSVDLGWPEHAGYRRSIERFLMDKYEIS